MSPRQYEFTDILQNGLFMNQSQVGMVFDFWQVGFFSQTSTWRHDTNHNDTQHNDS
jgi:hypothetical protein